MALGEQIKTLRRVLDLTQSEFAARIGVKRNTVATYEMGRSNPSDAGISLICREFGIREEWLRTGEGAMFMPKTREDEIAEAVDRMLAGENPDIQRRLVVAFSRFSPSDWDRLERELRFILDGDDPSAALPFAPDAPQCTTMHHDAPPVSVPGPDEADSRHQTSVDWDTLETDERALLAEFRRQRAEEAATAGEAGEPVGGASA